MNRATWRKSSYSGNNGGDCVEVGTTSRIIAVRDSKDTSGPKLAFDPEAWRAFAAKIKTDATGV